MLVEDSLLALSITAQASLADMTFDATSVGSLPFSWYQVETRRGEYGDIRTGS